MATLRDVVAYILSNYPYGDELSNARVCKMVYLADWRHAILHHTPITKIKWYFDNYGPYVDDVKKTVEENPELFRAQQTTNMFGEPKTVFKLRDTEYMPRLEEHEKGTLDHVIASTKSLTWAEFIKLVYSTYPIQSSERYEELDLVELAARYQNKKAKKLA